MFPTTLIQNAILQDEWNTGLTDLAQLIVSAPDTWWTHDPDLKYLQLCIDTRDGEFTLEDQYGKPASIDRVRTAVDKATQAEFQMVCGLSFANLDLPDRHTQVLLMNKLRGPKGVAGHANGPGGRVEKGETPLDAMVREFHEETGCFTLASDWEALAELRFDGGRVHFFVHRGTQVYNIQTGSNSLTDESVHWVDVARLWGGMSMPPADHLRWLVPLALDVLRGSTIGLPIVVRQENA